MGLCLLNLIFVLFSAFMFYCFSLIQMDIYIFIHSGIQILLAMHVHNIC